MTADFQRTVAAARAGDDVAFDSLFARNLPALIAFLRGRVGGDLAGRESIRDFAQSVCREVLMDMEGFEYRGDDAFRGWLFLQATRKIVDRYRYYKQARRDVAKEEPLPDVDAGELMEQYASICTPSQHAGQREELARVEDALGGLPEAQREAVLLSRIAGLSYNEIALQKGCTESAVRGLVARGLARLSLKLGK